MCPEGQLIDDKSLRSVTGASADWAELAKDCVCFANAQGGTLRVGIEDGEEHPPAGQEVTDELIDAVRKRIGERTINVSVTVQRVVFAGNGGAYIEVTVLRAHGPASTSDGRFYYRVSDVCKPLVGEDIQRLLDERSAQPWETLSSLGIPKSQHDPAKLADLASRIRASDRVKDSVKEKSDDELIDHYFLAIGGHLTNLGVLCIGSREARARLGSAPSIQFIKYDADAKKVHKISWDDYSLTPIELVEAVWREIPDFREYYELPV
ncbi:MAG: ATP-binding protein [Humidesulfovibrio sp.]|nr:ATP-binding protein [Humidesulfovibrio sp.]